MTNTVLFLTLYCILITTIFLFNKICDLFYKIFQHFPFHSGYQCIPTFNQQQYGRGGSHHHHHHPTTTHHPHQYHYAAAGYVPMVSPHPHVPHQPSHHPHFEYQPTPAWDPTSVAQVIRSL